MDGSASGLRPRCAFAALRGPQFVCLAFLALVAGCENGPRWFQPEPVVHGWPGPLPVPRPMRAVWIARFHYETRDDVVTMIRNCKKLGFNTVLWQARGNGTVLYRSQIEPFSEALDYRDPGFDPLAVAIEEAHNQGIRLEAWVNLMPGWRGPTPPTHPGQLYHAHPDWFLYDETGQRQPLAAVDPKTGKAEPYYVILNPCLPAVRDYLVELLHELASRYEMDGIHLDYVRYAWDTTPNARQLYPRDPATLRLYRMDTGKRPDDDPAAWDAWRANQLTRLVASIRDMLRRTKPAVSLSAAVWGDPRVGYQDYLQNAVGWLRAGLLDAAMPMAYTPELARFEQNITAYHQLAPGAHIVPGIGAYRMDSPAALAQQLQRCRVWGGDYAIFSYDSLRATAGDRKKRPAALAAENAQRRMRRELILDLRRQE